MDDDLVEVLLATADSRMYQNKADRKRRAREGEQRRGAPPLAALVETDIHPPPGGII